MTNDRFRDAIEIDFSGETVESKKQLEILMRVAGYNRKWDADKKKLIKRNPTQEQLNFAWEYLKTLKR